MKLYIEELIATLYESQLTNKEGIIEDDYNNIITKLINDFLDNRKRDCTVFFIGNGGSAAIASHMTADYMKNGEMNTYSLYDSSVMTCVGNDYGYEYVFSKPLSFLTKPGDLLVAISSSGKSKNILNAIDVVHDRKGNVITFTGFDADNPARQMGDINLYVPSKKYGIVESIHNLILQQIVDEIMTREGK